MKTICYCLFIFLCHVNIVHSQAKQASITKAIIKYESFTTQTSEAVKCQYFEATFKETAKTIVIEDEKKIAALIMNAKKMKPVENSRSFDVRLKLTLNKNLPEAVYCMDKFGVFTDGEGKYFENKSLYNFIISLLPGNGW